MAPEGPQGSAGTAVTRGMKHKETVVVSTYVSLVLLH
jgi:hypothetical protein